MSNSPNTVITASGIDSPALASSRSGGTNTPSGSSTLDFSKTLFNLDDSWARSACVFCGSSDGRDPVFKTAADQLGKALAEQNVSLVYGGGTNGLMGAIAHATYSNGGRVFGCIPRALMAYERKPGETAGKAGVHQAIHSPTLLSEADGNSRSVFMPVQTMHERKRQMAACSTLGFIALPGGYGTFEEIMEMVTWTQIRMHSKPVVLLNIKGFYTPMRALVRTAIEAGFIRPENESFLVFVEAPTSTDSSSSISTTNGAETNTASFDWGTAALEAVRKWHTESGKGDPYQLKWDTQDS